MSAREAQAALAQYPAQLVELVRADATAAQLDAEGFSIWEQRAVRTLVERADTDSQRVGRQKRRSDPSHASAAAP